MLYFRRRYVQTLAIFHFPHLFWLPLYTVAPKTSLLSPSLSSFFLIAAAAARRKCTASREIYRISKKKRGKLYFSFPEYKLF